MPTQRQHTNERMSQTVVHNGAVYLAGQVGEDVSAGVEQQTREALAAIECPLEEAGTDKTRILSVTIYLKDIDVDSEGMNRVWDQWLSCGVAPARATVEAKLCEPEILVKMSVVAALPQVLSGPAGEPGFSSPDERCAMPHLVEERPVAIRPARALIDLQTLRHSYRLAREATDVRAFAVIKVDVYGHGAVRCVEALAAEVDGLAVTCIEEGLKLREAGICQPILLLEGFSEAPELELTVVHDFWCVVHRAW